MKLSVSNSSVLNLPILKAASIISAILFATTACAQSPQTVNVSKTQSFQSSAVATKLSANVDSKLRQVLKQAGIKAQITSIVASN